mmetsp:Transcript_16173/g.46637  ORF Transcript_16173/g.46637 Transcript_16173/m.46637 type:complete len:222 (+) Transcript_16173:358-1023(+)
MRFWPAVFSSSRRNFSQRSRSNSCRSSLSSALVFTISVFIRAISCSMALERAEGFNGLFRRAAESLRLGSKSKPSPSEAKDAEELCPKLLLPASSRTSVVRPANPRTGVVPSMDDPAVLSIESSFTRVLHIDRGNRAGPATAAESALRFPELTGASIPAFLSATGRTSAWGGGQSSVSFILNLPPRHKLSMSEILSSSSSWAFSPLPQELLRHSSMACLPP